MKLNMYKIWDFKIIYCLCKFYCACQLPCQYIWQFHLMNGVITCHECVIGRPARHMLEVMILKLGSLIICQGQIYSGNCKLRPSCLTAGLLARNLKQIDPLVYLTCLHYPNSGPLFLISSSSRRQSQTWRLTANSKSETGRYRVDVEVRTARYQLT